MITNLSQLANLANVLSREIETQGTQILGYNGHEFHISEENFLETFEFYEKTYFSNEYDQLVATHDGVRFMALTRK